MGAQTFMQYGHGKTAAIAFKTAVAQAQYDHGRAGYSGSLAEKHLFVEIALPVGRDANEFANSLIDAGDPRIDDKWGPAGCIKTAPDTYMFFGWASS